MVNLTNDQIHALLTWTDEIDGDPDLAAARLVLAAEKMWRIKAGECTAPPPGTIGGTKDGPSYQRPT